MKRLLRSIREILLINKLIRFTLKFTLIRFNRLVQELQKRWPTYGLTDCEFKGVRFKMYNKGDDGLVYFFYYKAKYDEDADLSLFTELSKSSTCALDIGANTGLFSIISCIVNPQLKIYAFEPYGVNADRLKLNLEANRINNVEIVNEALGDKVGKLEMAVPKNKSITSVASANHSFAKSVYPELEWETTTVALNTIDNFREQLNQPVDLIKCDVETFEMSVFKGAHNVLKTDRPTIILECFLDNERRLFFNDILNAFEYFLYLILEDGIVYSKDGFPEINQGLNFLITPVKPIRNFISYKQTDLIRTEILLRPSKMHVP
jgi:FkbM family methyltransferase